MNWLIYLNLNLINKYNCMKYRVVLLGATGTVGAYAAFELQRNGYEVLSVGRRESDNGFFGEHGMQYLSLDITKK